MEHLIQRSKYLFFLISTLLCISSSCQDNNVIIVVDNLKNDICLLRLNRSADKLDDTVYLSDNNVGVLNCPTSVRLDGNLFNFVYVDENGVYRKIKEFNNNIYTDPKTIYFQHGMFTSFNDDSFLLFLIGRKKYLNNLNENFNVDEPYFEKKMKEGAQHLR